MLSNALVACPVEQRLCLGTQTRQTHGCNPPLDQDQVAFALRKLTDGVARRLFDRRARPEPERDPAAILIVCYGCNHRNAEIMSEIMKDEVAPMHLQKLGICGDERFVDCGKVNTWTRNPVVPPDRNRIAFDEFE